MGRDPEQQGELRRTAELAFSVLGSLSETSILVFDTELRYVLAGGGALGAHGYDAGQLEGRRLSEFMEGQAYERLAEQYDAALKGERRRFEHRTADGSKVYDIDVAPIERDGAIVGGLAISRDISERKQTERALAHSAREYRDLAEQASDVVSRSDEAGVYTYVSPASARVYGRAPDEMLGRSVFEFMHPDDHDAHKRAPRGSCRRRRRGDRRAPDVDPRRRLGVGRGALPGPARRRRPLHRRAVGGARHLRPQEWPTSSSGPRSTTRWSASRWWPPTAAGCASTTSLCDIVGYSREQLYGMTFQDITHPDDLDADVAQLEETLAGTRAGYQMEKRYLRPDGRVVWSLLSVSLVRDAAGAPLHFISQVLDISERKRLESELSRLATRDDLTGLYNRRFFEREVKQALRLLRRHGGQASVLFVDLDRFKEVNDTLGHQCGDDLLKHVALVLTGRLRESDVIARLGGDEFAVLLPVTGADGAAAIVKSLEQEFIERPALLEGRAVTARASIGVAELDAELDVDGVLRRADQAMYAVKRSRS